jgi:hypothetical protein
MNNFIMASGLSINQVAITIVAIAIGLVLIGSLLAPVASDVMAQLIATDSNGHAIYANGDSWSSLIGVVVIVSIIGLVVVAINSYTKN